MSFDVEEFSFESSNELNKIYGKMYIPIDIELKGIVQICHGMCEYIDKYSNFVKFLTSNGYIVCGHDQIGHGMSINSNDNLGYFAPDDGYKYLIDDLKKVTDIVVEKFPNLPIFLFGHSMVSGSYGQGQAAAQCAAEQGGSGGGAVRRTASAVQQESRAGRADPP